MAEKSATRPPRPKRISQASAWKRALIAGFVIQLLLILFVTAIGLRQLDLTTGHLKRVVDLHMRKQNLTKTMVVSARERSIILVLLSHIQDPFKRDELFLQFNTKGGEFMAARHALLRLPLTAPEHELLASQARLTNLAQPIQTGVIDLINRGSAQDAADLTLNEAMPAQDRVMEVLRQLDAGTGHAALAASRQAHKDHATARLWMYLLSAAALLVGAVVAAVVFVFTHRTTRERETLATHDPLTRLPNRMLFMDRLEQSLIRAQRHRSLVGLMFIDLDRFKRVNDTLGHASGDQLICEVANRLRTTARAEDIVARLGGDEFVIVIGDVVEIKHVLQVVEKMLAAVAEPYQVAGRELFCSCSIGVSVYPNDGRNSGDLLRNADTAMYHAKHNGRNRFQLYDLAMNAMAEERLQLETDLHYALARNEFIFHYQPQVSLDTGRIHAIEALIRWNHPTRGLLGPAVFLEMLEETGQIVSVGRKLLVAACRQTVHWHAAGFPHLEIAVNLSTKEFWHDALIENVQNALTQSGLPPHALQIELTEGIFMENMDVAVKRVHELKSLGITVSVDDFGTGYSSLAHLKRFPIDVLKIDRYFVKDIRTDPINVALVKSILALSRDLKLKNVVEGVETQAQLECLRSLGCNIIQGYLISRPVPATHLTTLLSRHWTQACNPTHTARHKAWLADGPLLPPASVFHQSADP